jgi:hypothetical protein
VPNERLTNGAITRGVVGPRRGRGRSRRWTGGSDTPVAHGLAQRLPTHATLSIFSRRAWLIPVWYPGPLAALLDGTDPTDPLGRLKTLLLGPKLQQAPDVAYPWDAGYLLYHLREALPPDSVAFLHAALATINDPAQVPDLDRFPLWRDTPALPLDTPWPNVSG